MKSFVYEKMPKVYFGEGALKKSLPEELKKVGNTVMIAYGGGSVKKTGIFDEIIAVLKENGKKVVEFTEIMSNPTYAKVKEGAKIAKENNVDFILAVGYKENISKFARFAKEVWKVDNKDLSEEETAKKGIEELEKFIKEIGLPTTLSEIEISDKEMLRKVADSSNITAGCCKQLTHDEIYEILLECV